MHLCNWLGIKEISIQGDLLAAVFEDFQVKTFKIVREQKKRPSGLKTERDISWTQHGAHSTHSVCSYEDYREHVDFEDFEDHEDTEDYVRYVPCSVNYFGNYGPTKSK